MLIRVIAQDDAPARARAAVGPAAEFFTRVDGEGGVAVVADPTAAARDGDIAAQVLFTGGTSGAQGGDWLFLVGLWTPADYRDEFLAWYRMEHLPILLECPLWDGCRFVEAQVGDGCQFYALHQLNDRAALDSDERKRSRATPWFRRLSQHDWFDGAFARTLYRRPRAE